MTTSILHLLVVLFLFSKIDAAYSAGDAQQSLHDTSNQRSADSNFKYAWFTREIHDDADDDTTDRVQQQQQYLRLRLLEKLLRRPSPVNSEERVDD